MVAAMADPELKLSSSEDKRPRVFITNILEPNGLFAGPARYTVTPITDAQAREYVADKRPLLFITQHAYMRVIGQHNGQAQIAMLQPHEISEVVKRQLGTTVYQASDELEMPLQPGMTILLAGIAPVVERTSKVLIQIGKPKVRAEVDWSLVQVEPVMEGLAL